MSTSRGMAAAASHNRGALDAVAFTAMMALDARQVLIAVRVKEGWSVRGAAAVAGAGAARPSLLWGAEDMPVGTPRSVGAEPVDDGKWRLSVPRWGRRVRHDRPDDMLAMTCRCADGSTVLLVVNQPKHTYSRERLKDLQWAVADAVVAEDERHRERLRESLQGREDERRRWARELHDETLQQLGALQVLLTSARRDSGNGRAADKADLHAAIDQAADLIGAQIVSLRHLINELRPSALDELGLRPPLEALAERTEQLTQMHVDMQVSLPYADGRVATRLLPDIELAIYRVVQEALTNAARHSHGTRARVVVIEEGGQVRVEVSDDGTGTGHMTGFGIEGMRERATLAGGQLEVLPYGDGDHAAGPGTTVRMVVPALRREAPTRTRSQNDGNRQRSKPRYRHYGWPRSRQPEESRTPRMRKVRRFRGG
jgi:signal transduction histidine kinase